MQGDQRSEDDQVAEVSGVAVEHAERDGYLPPTARALATTGGGATVFRFDLLETARLPLSLTDSRECDGPDVSPVGRLQQGDWLCQVDRVRPDPPPALLAVSAFLRKPRICVSIDWEPPLHGSRGTYAIYARTLRGA